jgi:hypothetical protein
MTILEKSVEEKERLANVANDKLTQAKDAVQEQLSSLQRDELKGLVDKKDQLLSHIETNYGDSWLGRHRVWVLVTTTVAVIVAYLFIRRNTNTIAITE